MKAKDTYVRARISSDLKKESEEIFATLGLSTTEAIRLFLSQVKIHRGLPFKVALKPNNNDLLMSTEKRISALDTFYDD
ncbi:MAG: type II toxin-antitoxin system RelB/DinJ family antitoxin [Lentisphaeraceae bacterium]|nr:type II toxin-antitoxin system RelB/DinJ family antitoxin [Lentisphaeraceae bacterium]